MIEISSPSATAEATSPAAAFLDALGDRAAQVRWIASLRAARSDAAAPPSLDWGRIVAIALAFALHLAALVHLMIPPVARAPQATSAMGRAAVADAPPAEGLQVRFVVPAARVDMRDVAPDGAVAPSESASAVQQAPPVARVSVTPPTPRVPAPMSDAAVAAATTRIEPRDVDAPSADLDAPEPPVRLFRSDGSVALPESVLERVRAVDGDEREFSFMMPGLAGAQSAFTRPPAVEYTPTRFDADWKPVRSQGEAALVAVSEALTYENRSGSFRCSLVPPVCSWGRIDTAVELNDPLTLNPEEAAQCQALWESIVEATDQQAWLRLRSRFNSECRKPLEADRTMPVPREVDPPAG